MAKKCPSDKVRYKRKQDAANRLQIILKNPNNGTTTRVRDLYACSLCGGYHLTSNPKHGTKGRVDRAFTMEDLKNYAREVRSRQLIEPLPERKKF